MYVINELHNLPDVPHAHLGRTSLSQPTSLEQWHRHLTHCSPSTILEMLHGNLVDSLNVLAKDLRGKCEDCIIGRHVRRAFDGKTEMVLDPLELVSFDLWGPSHVPSVGGKLYFMPIVDGGSAYKHGAYLSNKADSSTIAAFEVFCVEVEALSGRKVRRIHTDRAYDSSAWKDYCQSRAIIHELTAPYSSAQNGLAERAIRTTMDDVRTLLRDSDLGHSYWAEAASYSVHTRNLIPSRRHPAKIPLESLTGKRQDVSHLRVFGAKCWAKVPVLHGVQVTGRSKLDPRSLECRFLGYAGGHGNYKVQDVLSRGVFVSRDVVFEEGQPHRTSPSVGEQNVPLFDTTLGVETLNKDRNVETLDEDKQMNEQPDQSTNQRDNMGEIAEDQDRHIDNQRVNNQRVDDQRAINIPTESIQHADSIPLRRSS